ncbi:UDP-3-O-(3-hydroxymyristoyl)glucosamine N-acyltransferase [Sediminicoccus sp. KRV36]|uniref:UDP-3-O-(3-hydroxymyristoyl)glucosamine N-acyltransferase n=1 Tax=Sediminicoccus sp. KRV36 TaxID=3133721 RepID=UPI00200D210C|nr:UDP-3-O-(3-hydroxymyristoyl)glucosamine N-acyltransferase [Sediminicoccus rosea]UPY35950.1 UDP-3-O-(3-hydroxymyristoyl)glucosamine N-acyltransferase [Sediminicoccus rosea]
MADDPRFLGPARPLTLAAILAASGGQPGGDAGADAGRVFAGVAPLSTATPDQVSYCESRAYAQTLAESQAGLVLVPGEFAAQVPAGCIAVICRNPALAFGLVAAQFHPKPSPDGQIHPSATIHPEARIGAGTEIGPHAVIEAGAEIGRNCRIGPFALIGHHVVLGDDCVIHSHCSVTHAVLGRGVVLHPGARIGQEGFGFTVTEDGRFVTAPQLGSVRLGDGVEIGANSCVDRGSLGETVLGPGTRLDNLVQVGHNVRTGRGCILVAQVGVSGSTTLGDYVTAGGQSGFAGHLKIGSKVRIGAQAGVMNDIPPGIEILGSPAAPKKEVIRSMLVLKRLSSETRIASKPRSE